MSTMFLKVQILRPLSRHLLSFMFNRAVYFVPPAATLLCGFIPGNTVQCVKYQTPHKLLRNLRQIFSVLHNLQSFP